MSLSSRYELVLSRERGLAHAVANKVVDKPLISAWMILIPIVFVQYLISSRELRAVAQAFAREFVLTKKLALETALEMERSGMPKEDALTSHLSAEWGDEIEPAKKEIRERQRNEVELLVDHYVLLLRAEGGDYPSLVRQAYGNRAAYAEFLERLHEAESAVNRASVQAFESTEGFKETSAKAETAATGLRHKELDTLFPEKVKAKD
jgi:hypothetical protein